MGRVYRARHRRVGRQFAIKVLFGDVASHDNVVSRFEREAAAAGRLNHRNVVSVVDFGEAEGGLLYLAMDYVDGENLRDIIKRERPLDTQRITFLLAQLCQGLAHAHSKGLVHRDFKTDNILIGQSDDGEIARIVDFGIAMLSETANSSERLTTHGVVVGTPAYMSPEQAAGDLLDHRSDLFSLGLVLYEMLSGVLPFQGSAMGIMRSNLALEPPPISERVQGLQVDPGLETLAHELMAKDPDKRPHDANEVLARLEGMWTGLPRLASAPGISGSMSASISANLSNPAASASSSFASASASRSAPSLASNDDADDDDAMAFQPTISQSAMPATDTSGVTVGRARSSKRRGWLLPGVLLGLAVVIGVFLFTRTGDKRASQVASAGAQTANEPTSETPIEPTLVIAPSPSDPDGDATAPQPGLSRPRLPGQNSHDNQKLNSRSPSDSATVQGEKTSTDGRASKRRKRKTRRQRRERESGRADQNKNGSTGSTRTKKNDTTITTKSLTSRYRKVGVALDTLRKQRGEQISNPLEKRFLAIPFTDVLTDPELRKQTDASLRRLQRDIARAQKKQ